MRYTTDEILAIAAEKKTEHIGRNSAYAELEDVYFKNKMPGHLNKVLLRENSKAGLQFVVNLAKGKVKSAAALLSLLPDKNVTPPPDSGDDGAIWAELHERVIDSYWDHWRLPKRQQQAAHTLALKEALSLQLHPDTGPDGRFTGKLCLILWEPGNCYHEWKPNGELSFAMFIYRIGKRVAEQQWPSVRGYLDKWKAGESQSLTKDGLPVYRPESGYGDCEMILYIDDNDLALFANGVRVKEVGVTHNLGFVPVEHISTSEGWPFPLNGVYQEIALLENMNELILLGADARRRLIGADLFTRNVKLPEGFVLGEGSVIEGGDEGSSAVYVAPPITNTDMTGEVAWHDQMFRELTHWPLTQSGMSPATSIVTGAAVSSLNASVADMMTAIKSALSFGIAKMDIAAIRMEKRLFPHRKQRAYGNSRPGNSPYDFTYIPGEDLADELQHELVYPPMGGDLHSMIVWLLQLHGQKIISKRDVIERIPNFNPAETLRRLQQDDEREIRKEMLLMKFQQGLQAELGGAMGGDMGGGMPQGMPEQGMEPGQAEMMAQSLQSGGIPGQAAQLGGAA